MLKKFTKHPDEQNETYIEHLVSAWRIILLLKKIEAKCFIHSIFPFWYTDAISSKLECLNKMTERAASEEEPEELYEVYGGD